MKRTFLTKRNELLSFTNVSWGVFSLGFAFVVLCVRLLAPNLFWQVFTPVFRVADAATQESHAFLSSFGNTATLTAENERLREENIALTNKNQALSQKVNDTATLPPGILAGVVARPPESPYDTLVLASGTNEGVAVGTEAFGAGDVPLGVVSSVLASFSRVTLFSAPNFVTSGWVGDTNTVRAIVPLTISGAGAGAMNAVAPRSAGIAVGDIVFVPGPGMLPVGKVMRIDSDPTAPGVTLRIQSILNLFSVAWVTLRETGATLP